MNLCLFIYSFYVVLFSQLLKAQTKFLGRNWRKSNMKTMSAIYQRVRHRLNDDWAYGNGEHIIHRGFDLLLVGASHLNDFSLENFSLLQWPSRKQNVTAN